MATNNKKKWEKTSRDKQVVVESLIEIEYRQNHIMTHSLWLHTHMGRCTIEIRKLQ